MSALYGADLAFVQAAAFGKLAAGAAPEILRRLTAARCEVRTVLDVGCGAGVLTRALLDAGLNVHAIDPSAELLEYARRIAPTARYLNASAFEVDLPACQAIVALGESLTYHDAAVDAHALLRDFFMRCAHVLPPGGILMFDLIETGLPSLTARTFRAADDWALLVDTTEFVASNTLTRDIEVFRREGDLYRRSRETHQVWLFDTAEISALLNAAGFSVETAQSYGAQPLAPRRRAFFATRR
jgi:2-polyprenyl-3-methyl-5-hydroxy-6-metoxy-1,4-benzoquinol methylase